MGAQFIDQRGAEINVGGKTVNTEGGAYIGGNVSVGGDFVGRDKFVYGGGGEPDVAKAFTQLSAFVALHVATANVQTALQLVTAMQQALEQNNDEQVADCIGELGDLLVSGDAKEDLKAKLSRSLVNARLSPAAKYALRRLS